MLQVDGKRKRKKTRSTGDVEMADATTEGELVTRKRTRGEKGEMRKVRVRSRALKLVCLTFAQTAYGIASGRLA